MEVAAVLLLGSSSAAAGFRQRGDAGECNCTGSLPRYSGLGFAVVAAAADFLVLWQFL